MGPKLNLHTLTAIVRRSVAVWVACGFCALAGAAAPAPPHDSPAPPAAPVNSSTYIIGPGDTLQVFVWRNQDLSVTVPVRPDGKISTPLVADMVAVGKTPEQLADDLEKVLGEYVRSPKVNIIVSNAVSSFSQVKVIGQVKTPQSVPYREGLTALDAILIAGGLTQFAAGNRATVVHAGVQGKGPQERIRLNDLMSKGDLKQNILLKPGDVIVVPEARF